MLATLKEDSSHIDNAIETEIDEIVLKCTRVTTARTVLIVLGINMILAGL